MARPGAFMQMAHARFGDPVTIRTYWTEEPMVLFSHPHAVREIFRLDPAVAPAGESWEFLRPFAGQHSILLLDGEEHLRERRLMQTPFHGERMRAFRPAVAELAHQELATWHGRVVTLERMRELTLEIILRVVFGARGDWEIGELRRVIDDTLDEVRSMPRILSMALVRRDLGPRSPWGRFRLAVERFDALLFDLPRAAPAGRADHPDRPGPTRCSRCCSRHETKTETHRATGTCATSSSRCSSGVMTARPHHSRGRSSGSRDIRTCRRACGKATRPTSMPSSRRSCAPGRR